MDYGEAIRYLYGLERFGVKLGLENIRGLVAHFDHPESAYPTIHVAGTNGKGSVASMIASALNACGLSTGLYTSPHLERFEERIVVGKTPIATDEVARLADRLRQGVRVLLDRRAIPHHPTFFEMTTAMAMLHFRECGVDAAVFETGLGGRFDATNVVVPEVAVLTRIDVDHTAHLGETLAGIAFEKAGIIKPGVPFVTDHQAPEVLEVLREASTARAAPMINMDDGVTFRHRLDPFQRATLTVHSDGVHLPSLRLPLCGAFQIPNGLVALKALEVFARRTGRRLEDRAVKEGIERTRWPGRAEILSERPLVVCDCAHNPAGAARLAQWVSALSCRSKTLVFAVMKGKDVEGIADALLDRFDRVLLTRPRYERAMDPLAIRDRLSCGKAPEICPSASKAVFEGLWALGSDDLLCVAGSCFLVGEVRGELRRLIKELAVRG